MCAALVKSRNVRNEKLRRIRKQRSWTQNDLADELYALCRDGERTPRGGVVNVNMVSAWERGQHQPSSFWQKKLCELFDCTPEGLGFSDEASVSPSKSATFLSPEELSFHEQLVRYMQHQQMRLCDSLTSGSMHLRVGDVIGSNGLFVPPHWEGTIEANPSSDLCSKLMDLLCQRQSVLLLGEAGQGKTTLVKHLFVLLAERFTRDSAAPVPIYISLRELMLSFVGNPLDVLWEQVGIDFPLEYEDFISLARSRRILFLFDGFDEMRGEITQQSVNERASSKIFTYPSLLSCRKSFFDFYLSHSPIKEMYARYVELLSSPLSASWKQYINAFLQRQQRESQAILPSSETIITLLETNRELSELAQRPLFLLMILEIFTSTKKMEGTWTVNKLYRNYTEGWLKNEAAKPDSVLRWSEKQALLQETAWHTYHVLKQRGTFMYDELMRFIGAYESRYPGRTGVQLVDDLCFRTLLSVEGEDYAFLHKSIQEYYVARYVWERMRSHEQEHAWEKIEQALSTSLPFDVALFLKQSLKESTLGEKDAITSNLVKVYQRNQAADPQCIVIRQQASHYLTSLDSPRAIQFLERVCEQESDKWVQRGIMVGLALYCRRQDILDRYVHIVRKDAEAATINLGYHLVYYGDLPTGTDYHVDHIGRCERTIVALFRHLKDKHYYQIGWSLDILTLSALILQKGLSILEENDLAFLNAFCQQKHDLGPTFQEEKLKLKALLRSE